MARCDVGMTVAEAVVMEIRAGMQGQVVVGALPSLLFTHGHLYFVARLPQRRNVIPFAIHNTYQYSGNPGKRHRFREEHLWVDSPSYHRDGLFFAMETAPPAHLIRPHASLAVEKGGTPHAHLALLQWHVDTVRVGLAIASILGRTLIMPKLPCTCDRWFNLLPNCSTGEVQLPFNCPMDHVFLLQNFERANIEFREHSFLSNPRTPEDVRSNSTLIEVKNAWSGHSVKDGVVTLKERLSDVELREALQPYHASKVLIIRKGIEKLFRGFEQNALTDQFNNKMRDLTHSWCCRRNGTVDHPMAKLPYLSP
ncbi:hypothetical protein CYMTET_56000 [Cymbomonas tetramitiformis]|uniref:Uncharacterized protein n=1 Tax=Cymbomonas tetramitiformis TaxID=36881 RepID=A0AAE0BC59_9CHLO|nr:hypothetical protein CYMTET_56000 [Cymbomonas tetramitiformis]